MSTTHESDTPSDPKHHMGERAKEGAKPSALTIELREHLPFSVSAVAIGLVVTGAICILVSDASLVAGTGESGAATDSQHEHGRQTAQLFFHLFHASHMLFSAAATTAMFCRYDTNTAKAIVVGLTGAIGVCGVSDILVPHVSAAFLGAQMPWHICVYEDPTLVLPFAGVGVGIGIAAAGGVMRSTIFSHSLHVLVSTMASIFYMVGPLGMVAWIDELGMVFLFVVVAVMVPCCVSDIVYPTLLSRAARTRYEEAGHQH